MTIQQTEGTRHTIILNNEGSMKGRPTLTWRKNPQFAERSAGRITMAEPNSGLEVHNGGGDAKTTTATTTEILETASKNFTAVAGPATADRVSVPSPLPPPPPPTPPPPPAVMATTSATSGGSVGGGGTLPRMPILHLEFPFMSRTRVGSTLGPYFCLGQLGKGTFSSVHKCVN